MYQEIFKHVLKRVNPFIKTQDITCRTHTFYKSYPQGKIGIINFQRNREGLPRVTISVGSYSLLLAAHSLFPMQYSSQQKNNDWKKYADTTHHIEQLFNKIDPLIFYYRNPEIDEHISDEHLKIKWFSQVRACRLAYLCILLKHAGKKAQLNPVLNEFGELMQTHPEFIALKKSYDRCMQAANNKQAISEEKSAALDKLSKKTNP